MLYKAEGSTFQRVAITSYVLDRVSSCPAG
jgi:hypothetical protein